LELLLIDLGLRKRRMLEEAKKKKWERGGGGWNGEVAREREMNGRRYLTFREEDLG